MFINDVIEKLHRSVLADASEMAIMILRSVRLLLLNNLRDLDRGGNETERLENALSLNTPLTTA
jgi:hypothetical protein